MKLIIKFTKSIFILFMCLVGLIGCSNQSTEHTHNFIEGICSCGEVEEVLFKVFFVDYNGDVLKEVYVKKNSSVDAPSDPTREGYEFTGWSTTFDNIISDLVIVAQYEKISDSIMHNHEYTDGKCECGYELFIFELIEKNQEYKLVGINENNLEKIVIPQNYNDLPVTKIDLEEELDIKCVELPDTISELSWSFVKCTNLEKVIISSSLYTIGDYSFFGCENLKEIIFPENSCLMTIEYSAFRNCNSLISINLPNSILKIQYDAFGGCDNLTNVILGNNLSQIDVTAFIECPNLKYNIYNNCKYLGTKNNPYFAFIEPVENDIQDLTFHENTEIVSNYSFNLNNLITAVNFEKGIYLGTQNNPYFLFVKCTDLNSNSIIMHDETIIIHESALSNSSIKSIIIPEKVKIIGMDAFKTCDKLESVEMSNNVKFIGSSCFHDCKSLKTITLSNNLQTLESNLLSSCKLLNNIIIPKSIIQIKAEAFKNCTNLTKITIPDNVSCIGYDVFFGSNDNFVIYTSLSMKPSFWDINWNRKNYEQNFYDVMWNYPLY